MSELYTVEHYAFFDVDGTIIYTKSMFSFLKYFYLNFFDTKMVVAYKVIKMKFFFYEKVFRLKREKINRLYYNIFSNIKEADLNAIGEKWFLECLSDPGLYNEWVMERVKAHKNTGGSIVLVSGSMNSCLRSLAIKIGADFIICTKQKIINGYYTGEIEDPQTIGEGKAEAIRLFCKEKNYNDLQNCHAYGDHLSDLPMLKIVGHPHIIKGDPRLERKAKINGWEII